MKKFKMYLPDIDNGRELLSEKVQLHAFRLGYVWNVNGLGVCNQEQPFILFHKDRTMTYFRIDCADEFYEYDVEEITPELFFGLTKKDICEWAPVVGEIVCARYTNTSWYCGVFTKSEKKKYHPYQINNINNYDQVAPFEAELIGTNKIPDIYLN